MHAFKSIIEAKMLQYSSCWWPKRNTNEVFLYDPFLCLALTGQHRHLILTCMQVGKTLCVGPLPSDLLSLSLFISPSNHCDLSFSFCATQPKRTQHCFLSVKDFQKLLCVHTLSQTVLWFPHLSSQCCPSLTSGLLAGHGGFPERAVDSQQPLLFMGLMQSSHTMHSRLPSFILRIKPYLRLGWAVTGRGRGDNGVPGASCCPLAEPRSPPSVASIHVKI